LFSFVKYHGATWLHQDLMALSGSKLRLPPGYGYGLAVVYAVWIGSLVLLYPLCRWFAGVKRRRREWIFRYF